MALGNEFFAFNRAYHTQDVVGCQIKHSKLYTKSIASMDLCLTLRAPYCPGERDLNACSVLPLIATVLFPPYAETMRLWSI